MSMGVNSCQMLKQQKPEITRNKGCAKVSGSSQRSVTRFHRVLGFNSGFFFSSFKYHSAIFEIAFAL